MDSSRYQPSCVAACVSRARVDLRTLSTRTEDWLALIPAVLPSPASVKKVLSWCPTPWVGAMAGGPLWASLGVPSTKLCVTTDLADSPALRGQIVFLYVWAHIRIVTLKGSASLTGTLIPGTIGGAEETWVSSSHVLARVPRPGVVGAAAPLAWCKSVPYPFGRALHHAS